MAETNSSLLPEYVFGLAWVLLCVSAFILLVLAKFFSNIKSLRTIFFRTTSVSVRIFHISILINCLLALAGVLIVWGYHIFNTSPMLNEKLWFIGLAFLSPFLATLAAWIATETFTHFWQHLDFHYKDSAPIIIRKDSELDNKGESLNSTLASIAADMKAINDRYTQFDADFTLRYVNVVRSLETLQGTPPISEQVTPSRGFHLCLSTDNGLVKLDQPHSFLFQASQRIWAERYKQFKREDAGPVYIFSDTSQQTKYSILDNAIRSSIELCFASIENIQNNIELEDLSIKDISTYGQTFVYPRAIRLIVSTVDELIDVLYNHYTKDFDGWILTGPSSGILNLWIPTEAKNQMHVTNWRNGEDVDSNFFHAGLFDNNGKTTKEPTDSITFNYILKKFIDAWATDSELGSNYRILHPKHFPASNIFTNEVLLRSNPSGFVSVGWVRTMVGERGEGTPTHEIDSSPWNRRAFLEVLPIILMALHCKKGLFFDWIYRAAIQDLDGATRGSKKEPIKEKLREVILSQHQSN